MKNILKGLETITVKQNYPKVVINPTIEEAVENILRVSKNTDLDASVINNNTAVFEKAIRKLSSKHNGFVVLSVATGAICMFSISVAYLIMLEQEDKLKELKDELNELKSKSEPEEWETTEE